MLCGVNWRLESACGFSEGVREDAPLIIRWSQMQGISVHLRLYS